MDRDHGFASQTLTAEPGRYRPRDEGALWALVISVYPAFVQQRRNELLPLSARRVERDGVLATIVDAANHEEWHGGILRWPC